VGSTSNSGATSKFYKITVSGGVASIASTPLANVGCTIVPQDYCTNSVLAGLGSLGGISTGYIKAFVINPVSKNIYFQAFQGVGGGTWDFNWASRYYFRMTYDATNGTYGAPQKVYIGDEKLTPFTPRGAETGISPLVFDSAGRLYLGGFGATNILSATVNALSLFQESSNGFTQVSGSALPFTMYDPLSTNTWARAFVRSQQDHMFGLTVKTLASGQQMVQISYSEDTNVHVCTSSTGSPVTTSCTVGAGSDPNPLIPGQVYGFDVMATNTSPDGSTKNGPLSTNGTFQASGPAAPTLTNLSVGGTLASPTATATFRPSLVSAGVVDTSITSYVCTLYSVDGVALATKTVTPPSPIADTTDITCGFTAADGLTNGGKYQVGITATNSVGTSLPATGPLIVTAAPVAPAPVYGATSGDVTTITYTPQSTGTHTVQILDPATNLAIPNSTCTGATINNPSCTVNGLVPGMTYALKACTSNVYAASPACTTTSYTVPLAIPSAPVVTTKPSDSTIDVSWPTPPNNGSVITGYTVTVSPGGGTGCTSLGASATSCQLTGLTNGTNYTIEVQVNYTLNGVAGVTKVATTVTDTPFVTPDVPQAPTAVAKGSEAATVTYTPTNDNGTPVSSYTFYAYDVNGNIISPNLTCTAVAPATSCDVTGLTEGTTYKFGVVANFQGQSGGFTSTAMSPLSNPVTPTGVIYPPDAPTNVTATGDDHSAQVSWTAPANDGGSPVTGYTVTAYDSNGNVVGSCTATAPTTTCLVEGLALGQSYTFTVVATNSAGDSTPSDASSPVQPTGVDPTEPGPVLDGATTPGDGHVVVTWTAPNTGDVPTSYEVTVPGFPACVIDLVANPNAALSCDFTGLTNGTEYTFTIVAKNAQGSSTSVDVSATPFGTPAVPTVTTVVTSPAGDGALVTFTHPSNTGGGAVTGYTVTAYDVNGNVVGTCTTTGTSCTITGLTKGATYSFKAQMNTTHGNSAQSAPKSLLIPSGYQKVNAYIRGWSYAQREISDGMRKAIGAAARLIVASGNKTVTVTGFANFTALKSLSRDRAVNVAAYLRHELNRFGGRSITIKVVNGGCTTKFGGTVLNRVAVIQGR